ncbi:MAG: hypothetical protein WA913_10080 [Pricia sp.]
MKISKIILLVGICASFSVATAQEISDNAIGLRLGDSDGFGAEISYQRLLGRYTRAEIDLGYRDSREHDAIKLTGLYQWVHSIDRGFNWYYGFGAGIGSVDFEPVLNENNPNVIEELDGGFFALFAGDIGIEYNFDIPVLVSLDIRPEYGVVGFANFDNRFNFDIALGVRYQF